jgi:hypothetical protein
LGLKLWHPNARQAAVLSRHRAYLNFIKIEVDIRYKGPFLDSAEEDLMVFGPLKSQSIYQYAICLNSAMIFVKSFVSPAKAFVGVSQFKLPAAHETHAITHSCHDINCFCPPTFHP